MTNQLTDTISPSFARTDNLRYWSVLLLAAVLPWSLALMQIAYGLVIFATLLSIFFNGRRQLPAKPFFIVVAIYLTFRFLSAAFSPTPATALTRLVDYEWPLTFLPVLLLVSLPQNRWKRVLSVLFFSMGIAALYGLWQFFAGYDLIRQRSLTTYGSFFRTTGGYNFYLTYAGNLLLSLFVGIGLLQSREKDTRSNLWMLLFMLPVAAALVTTFARSTWVAVTIVIILWVALRYPARLLPVLGTSVLIGLLIGVAVPEIRERIVSIFTLSANSNRLNVWHTTVNMLMDHPLLGIGPGRFREVFPLYEVIGKYDTKAHAHNDLLHIAVISGIPAAIAWAGMWLAWFRELIEKGQRQCAINRLPEGLMMAIAALLIAGLFQCYYADLENNLFMMMIIWAGLDYQRSIE